ncbi:MAG: phospholipase D-like domain-containing protein, partial [Candidatus Eisenbacteria bacterium]
MNTRESAFCRLFGTCAGTLLIAVGLSLSRGSFCAATAATAGAATTPKAAPAAMGGRLDVLSLAIEEFEIVESVPIETDLDNAGIRNALEVWLEMIDRAKNTLDLAQFYVSDEPGEPLSDVIEAVVRATKRGVCVRFVVDARMYRTYPERLDWLAGQKRVEVRKIDMARLAGGIMHAKYFIVDGEELFLGSQNFD